MSEQDKGSETLDGTPSEDQNADTPPKTDEHKVELTPEQQAELDRRVSKGIEKGQETLREKLKKEMEEERKKIEAERLAEQGKFQELAEQKQAELDALKAEKAAEEFRAGKLAALSKEGLGDFADLVSGGTVEEVTANAKALREKLDAELEKKIQERISTPKKPVNAGDTNTNTGGGGFIGKMTYPSLQA